jgi:CRP-like cAMP-binding protein
MARPWYCATPACVGRRPVPLLLQGSEQILGRELVLAEHGPGEYFGELSIDGEKRSASIKAMETCSCRVVQGSELRQFLAEHPAW